MRNLLYRSLEKIISRRAFDHKNRSIFNLYLQRIIFTKMNKTFFLLLLSLFILSSCGESKKGSSIDANNSKIEFENTTFDFGKIAFRSDGTCIFTFTNTSMKPLIINVVRTSCGCTNPDWPKDPLDPGKSGEIKVTYNTQIPGSFQKSITVFCNAVNSPVKLIIKGEVLPDTKTSNSYSNN